MARKKVTVRTDNSTWKAPKVRKKRKPMTEEQKAAAAERLAKAREKKAAGDPIYGQSGIHESLRNLPDDYPLHPKKVKVWIKTQKDLANAERKSVRQGIKGALARQGVHEGYVRNMKTYLRSGDWIDMFYGEHQEHRIRHRCVALAYDKDGNPKRNVGTFYPDINMIWTQELENEERGIDVERQRKRSGRKRNKRAVEKRSKTA